MTWLSSPHFLVKLFYGALLCCPPNVCSLSSSVSYCTSVFIFWNQNQKKTCKPVCRGVGSKQSLSEAECLTSERGLSDSWLESQNIKWNQVQSHLYWCFPWGEEKKKVKPACDTPYRAVVCAYCLVYRHRDACLHVSWSGGEEPLLVGFNVCVLPAGQVFGCLAACLTAKHHVCGGCCTSGVISSARILVRLKLRVHAVQLIGSQVQTGLQTPPAEWREIDRCARVVYADVQKVKTPGSSVSCVWDQQWTLGLKARALPASSSAVKEAYEWQRLPGLLSLRAFFVILPLTIDLEIVLANHPKIKVVCGNGGWGR